MICDFWQNSRWRPAGPEVCTLYGFLDITIIIVVVAAAVVVDINNSISFGNNYLDHIFSLDSHVHDLKCARV